LSSGAINSTTKAKDQATILWRENSSSYDSKRAVQVPSQQPTGHAVKRKRQDDETEYQYRKRLLANTQDNNEDDIADDPNIETAISIKNSCVTGSMGLVMLSMSSSCCDVQFLK
jgi:hypothetical protein